jgi:excinuclease ABC subunit A
LAVKINGLNISQLLPYQLAMQNFFEKLDLKENKIIARPILKEINERLEFLLNVD